MVIKVRMHKGFDHARFADIMDDTMGNVMISYNNHPDIVQRFLKSGDSMTLLILIQ